MKPTILSIIILLVFLNGSAQDNLDHQAINNSRIGRPAVKVGLTHVVNYSEALIPISVEYRPDYMVGLEAGIGIPLFFNTLAYKRTSGPQKELHFDMKYRGGFRFYFQHVAENLGFIGLDGSYRNQRYTIINESFYDNSGTKHPFNSVDINKSVYTINVIIGMQTNFSKRLFAEILSGLGYKEIKRRQENIQGVLAKNERSILGIDMPIGAGEDRLGTKSGIINIPLSIKICYRL